MEYSPELLQTRLLEPVETDATSIRCDTVKNWLQIELFLRIVAVITAVLSVMIMIKERNVTSYVAFSIPLITAPYAIFLCKEVNQMKSEQPVDNDELIKKKENLEKKKKKMILFKSKVQDEASRKESLKNSLNGIAMKCGVNTIELLRLVKENRITSEKIINIFKGEVSQIILQFLLDTDVDGNFEFDDHEIEILILKFSVLHFCDIDVDKFRSALHAMKGEKIACFAKLAKDICLADFDKYGLAFDLKL